MKELILGGVKLGRLERRKRSLDMRPGLLAFDFGDSFDEQGESTELHVYFDAFGQPVVHQLHLDPGALKGPEGPLDHKEPLITGGCIFDSDGIVVSLEHPFAIVS